MKIKRQTCFAIGAILLLIGIAALMFVIGRGHILYIDDKTIDMNGTSVNAKYHIEVSVNGAKSQEIAARERIQEKVMGQNLKIELKIQDTKRSLEEKEMTIKCKIPYNYDTAVISLPLLIEGYDQSEWMTEFVQVPTSAEKTEEVVVTDDFSMGDF